MPTIKSSADLRNNYNEIYGLIKEGMDDIVLDNTRPFNEAMSDIRSSL